MTSAFSRYAIYAVPDPASPLFLRASRWLGWDSVAAAAAQFPQRHELDNPGSLDIELITRTPRKYGFHGTLKPPMRLAEGHDEAMLIAKAGKLPTLAAMKTTKLQDADCANKDVYEMILGAFPFVSARTTGGREMEALSGHTGTEL